MVRPDPELWDAIHEYLKTNHAAMCRHWFDDIEPIELGGGTMWLLVREPTQRAYLQRRCQRVFAEATQATTNLLLGVRFISEDDVPHIARLAAQTHAHNGNGHHPPANGAANGASNLATNGATNGAASRGAYQDDILISPDFSFDQFVVGPGNRLAHAAAVAVSEKPGRAYNPFFVHGGVGLGKTHLLHAICQAALRHTPDLGIHYVPCEQFMTQFMEAVQAGEMPDFRHRFRNVDILVIDDIHDLAKRDRTQEEFFHTFNELYASGKQIVLSSDAAPNEITDLEERLRSRFNSGLVARIDKPTYETRVAIIKQKGRMRNITMPDEVAAHIATILDTNIRELDGAIVTVDGYAAAHQREINLETARLALEGVGAAIPGAQITIQMILDAVASHYGIKVGDLLSKRRFKSIAQPRQVAMWLARRHTRFSLEEIGGFFGGRDHTTVLHAVRTVEKKRTDNPQTAGDIDALEARLSPLATD